MTAITAAAVAIIFYATALYIAHRFGLLWFAAAVMMAMVLMS